MARRTRGDGPPAPLALVSGLADGQGIGTSNRDHGYALTALRALRAQRDPRWRVINVSRSGARVRDVLTEQLALLDEVRADLVTCAAGANDLVPTPRSRAASTFTSRAERDHPVVPEGYLAQLSMPFRRTRERDIPYVRYRPPFGAAAIDADASLLGTTYPEQHPQRGTA